MKKLVKKVLTDKKARNMTTLSVFMVTMANVGNPWTTAA